MGSEMCIRDSSSSEYKAAALRKLKIDFEQIDPNINEALHANEQPREACQRLALSKARTVAENNPGAVIIGADQIGTCNQNILSKTRDKERAFAQILAMNGKLCYFLTAIAVAKNIGASGIHTELYNFPLCSVPKSLQKFCVKSISDWKQKYLSECDRCSRKKSCCGFFEWYDGSYKNIILKIV